MMNIQKTVFTVIFLAITLITFAQSPVYQVKKVDGKEYLLYPVQSGEGLYGIARRFNTTIKILNDLNPDAANGLKTGQIILIPFNRQEISAKVSQPKVEEPKTEEKKEAYIHHLVEKKQTLFAITKMYTISQDELFRVNPELKDGLKTGMVIKIPAKYAATQANVKTPEKQSNKKLVTIKHTVQPHETLYALSRKYKVKVDDIVSQNPETYNGIVIGTDLYIDVKKEIAEKLNLTEASKPVAPVEEIITLSNEEVQYLTHLKDKIKPNQNPIKIAVLLPLTINSSKTDVVNERFQEFYAGFLIAVNEAKNKGVSLEINTFETEKSEEKIADILLDPKLKSMDLIIGPAYSNQISYITDFAFKNKINTIIPFSSKVQNIVTNPYLYQFNPNSGIEVQYFCELMKRKYSTDNLILVNIPGVSFNDGGFSFYNELKNNLMKENINYKIVENTTDLKTIANDILSVDKKNIFVFNTDKYTNVYPYLSFLNQVSSTHQITLYEQYSWKKQSSNTKFNAFSIAPFKPLHNDSIENKYNAAFKKYFNWKNTTSNPRYDLLGYDLGNYFIALIYEFGPQFGWGKTKLPLASGVQSFLRFEREDTHSGFINSQLYQHVK